MRLTLAFTLLLAVAACAHAGVPALALDQEQIEIQIDSLFEEFNAAGSPGASVGVFFADEIIFQGAYGTTDLESDISNATETNMRLASITKQFTAMAILILRDRGDLSLDDPLTTFFPDFPEVYETITVRHLLTHTSGVISYENLMPDEQTEQIHDHEIVDLLRTQHGTYFTPGTDYRYSNSGYALLAMIVEQVSGKTFPEFLDDEIFTPLGMTNTVAFIDGVNEIPNRAFGYRRSEDGGFDFADQSPTSAVLGDGGIYSSIPDLFLWTRALNIMQGITVFDPPVLTDHLVERETVEEALTPFTLANGESTGYGYGWRIEERHGVEITWHSGGTCGFHNCLIRIPERHLTVAVLMNLRGGGATDAAHAIVDMLLNGVTIQ